MSKYASRLNPPFGLFLLLLAILTALPAYAQVDRAFTPRFSTNAHGNITFVANALTTCQASATSCQDSQNGAANQNNDFTITHIDVDNVGTSFNSSSSALALPSTAQVLWAGLYWSAGIQGLDATELANRYTISFDTPATTGFAYQSINATQEDDDGYSYMGFAEVTSLVQAAGNGAYTVANVQVDAGSRNRFAGWTLIVVYEDQNEPLRNLTVFDGSAQVSSNTPTVSFTADGFTTPFNGAFDTFLGVVATDGDFGFVGDRFVANGADLQDVRGRPNDFFNSSITLPSGSGGANQHTTNRSPAFTNTLGYDADLLKLPTGIVGNGDTSVDFEVTTGGESISLHAVTFAIDIYRPDVIADKQVRDLNGGQAKAGDVLEYAIVVTNTGADDATNVILIDPIPANTTYVPNSLVVSAGSNAGAKSDTDDTDQAEYDATDDAVTFRIGTGADGTSGGALAQDETTTLTFRVTIDNTATDGTTLFNRAVINYTEDTLGGRDVSTGDATTAVVGVGTDLTITKSDDVDPIIAGQTVTYTLEVDNDGPEDAHDVLVSDPLPGGTTFVAATAPGGWSITDPGAGNAGTVQFARPMFANGSTAQFTITVGIDSNTTDGTVLTNTATIASTTPDVNGGNNDAAETTWVQQYADLSLTKAVSPATVAVGSTATFTLALTNDGPADATGVAVEHVLPQGVTFVSANPASAYDVNTSLWAVGTIASGTTTALELVVTIDQPGTVTNTAEVVASDQPDPDSTPGNNDTSEDDYASAMLGATGVADLSLNKTVDNPIPDEGDTITFSVTVSNDGPNGAAGVVVTDVLPVGLTFQQFTQAPGPNAPTYNASTRAITWTPPAFGYPNCPSATCAPSSWTLTYTVQVDTDQPVENVAEVSASDQTDPDSTPGDGQGDDSDRAAVTPQGSSGGGGGGVESDGNMASKLAQRLFHRRADAQQRRALRTEPAPVPLAVGHSKAAFATASTSSADLNLADYVPEQGPQQSAAVVTTPTDLLGITNASSVFAADYLRPDGRRLGAIFGTTTPRGTLYDHTKNTCDRLAGGRLDDVRLVDVEGRSFVLSKLIHPSGEVDYAISFNAYQTDQGFVIDSRFAPDTYEVPAGTREVLSFQVWSAAPVFTETLVADVLAKLDADNGLTFINDTATGPHLPSLYVQSGSYHNGLLTLHITNTSGEPQTIELVGSTAMTEGEAQAANRTDFVRALTVPAPASDAATSTVTVDVETGYLFDAAFALTADDNVLDRVYWSDGPWGTSAGTATIASFETYGQDEAALTPGMYQVERSAYIGGTVTDYAALFRYLRPSAQPVDLSAYTHVEFTAYGQGRVQFFAEKARITDGDHYGASMRLGTTPKIYRYAFSDLAQISGTTGFTAEDVTALVFYVNGNGQSASPFDLVIEDVRFTGATTVATEPLETPTAMVLKQNYPNPFNPVTTIGFEVPQAQHVTLTVYDLLGRPVQTLVDGLRSAGQHEAVFDAASLPSGTYVYRLETAGHALSKTLTLLK